MKEHFTLTALLYFCWAILSHSFRSGWYWPT